MQPPLSKRWKIGEPVPAAFHSLLKTENYPPLLVQALYNRGYRDLDSVRSYLSCGIASDDPFQLKDMQRVVERLLAAIDAGQPLAVYGDYDVDGVTATVLMTQVLRVLGGDVRPYIPNRYEEGYGLNNDALDALAAAGIRVVLTVDCGIRSFPEVTHARQAGLDLIISDHHAPLGAVPADATAVVCQRQEGDGYPDKNLAGVGIAYKIAQALFERRPQPGFSAEHWLDLVALGTVADVVPLTGENRRLVRAGIERIRRGQRQGLLSLVNVAGIQLQRCSASEIGFGLAPRLNAAGRIESATRAMELLMADALDRAAVLAQELDNQNRERQSLTRKMQQEADGMIQASECDHLLFAFHPEFKSGVVGLVAARLTEMYYRPAIVGATDGEYTRASCRSIDEFHITNALDECADLLVRHGGHAKAAGFTVRNDLLDILLERMEAIAARELSALDLRPSLRADMEIELENLRFGEEVFGCLEQLEPTGHENPEMVFVSRNLKVLYPKAVGAEGAHLKMNLTEGKGIFNAIAFRQGHWLNRLPERVDILYTVERNYYNGRESLQLNVRDMKPSGAPD